MDINKKGLNMEKIAISTPTIQLNNLLKFANLVGSGGQAKYVIKDGLVKLNGETCLVVRKQCVPGDIVEFEGTQLEVVSK